MDNMPHVPQGILLVDKPKGVTSFAVVRTYKKKLHEKKVGHAGTLDPLASGLLILGYGAGTKLLRTYMELPKVYEAQICFGERSATGDAEGPIVEMMPVHDMNKTVLINEILRMQGVLRLPVSLYSAMKRGGEPLYKKVRRGEDTITPLRDMEVFGAALLGEPKQVGETVHATVRFSVGSGTYVRSLAEELGQRLGYPARLENLRRTQVGEFKIEDAKH